MMIELHERMSSRVLPDVAWARADEQSETLDWAGQHVQVSSTTVLAWNTIAGRGATAAGQLAA